MHLEQGFHVSAVGGCLNCRIHDGQQLHCILCGLRRPFLQILQHQSSFLTTFKSFHDVAQLGTSKRLYVP